MKLGLFPKLLQSLIQETIYQAADPKSQIPDVDQMATFLHEKSNCQSLDLESFTFAFLQTLANPDLLENSFFDGVIQEITNLLNQHSKIKLCSWTQGNVFLQTKKAQIFQTKIAKQYLATPSIYASIDKIQLLPNIVKALTAEGAQTICLIDDRPGNIQKAYQTLIDHQNLIFINKIRPDKSMGELHLKAYNVFRVKTWQDIAQILEPYRSTNLALILDKDGIVFHTTHYRKLLESFLQEWLVDLL